uniref:Reverse transcriptase Ty1/copia-type domain-containing protein n=1 Tax=Solanum lycopersicum TaxID=4081 RepID=A0A3Q7IFZ7_SOLLC
MLVVGHNTCRIQKLKLELSKSFAMKDLGPTRQILGMQIVRDRKTKKLKVLHRFSMDKAKVVSTPLAMHFKLSTKQCPSSDDEKEDMKKVPYASAFMYAMVCTRPDIAHAVGVVSHFLSNPGREHWNAVKWVMRYLCGTSSLSLCFGTWKPILCGYTNSEMAGDVDTRKSTSGYLGELCLGNLVCKNVLLYLLQKLSLLLSLKLKAGLEKCTSQPTPMAVSLSTNGADTPFADITHFRSLIGALQYLAITQTDIQFAVNRVGQRMHQPSEHDYYCLKRILRYIFGTLGRGLLIRPGDLELRGFSNSDWANDKNDKKSTSGLLIFLGLNLIS